MAAPALAPRLGTAGLMAAGFLLAATGFGILGIAAAGQSLALLILGYCTFSLGLAPVFTLTTDLIVGSVPPAKAGAAAGLSEASTELGGAFGIAVLGSLMSLVYRLMLDDVPHLVDLPLSVATGEGASGADLVAASRAMGRSLQVSAYLCGLIAALGAMLTWLTRSNSLRSQPTGEVP